ncbi:hypothetical protein QMK19_35165 [Streptomyces sp. H10-C2]|uniref:hypothetical protein n=1 Tax=unclassified Streptomyces TaxID=2593676 RepID=UPI0024B8E2E9|nr:MULTISPECIES: hypothetical protein [unclassified Streptomyces]MDJ0345875.1 hypothetical protein [Streptomyces sp. PH10-H1]MDJ0374724.1 hypothetical protein [Streptomyces sp. H10-C2]
MKNPTLLLWQAITGKSAPRSVTELVDAAGGTEKAARLAGVSPGTVRGWRRQEVAAKEAAQAAGADVRSAAAALGGTAAAAAAAGVSERTVRRWAQQERDGRAPGRRQQAHIDRLRAAAVKAHEVQAKAQAAHKAPNPRKSKLLNGVLNSAEARKRAVSPRRAQRIATGGARVQMKAYVTVISTDQMEDNRYRDQIDVEFRGEVLREPMQAWLNGESGKDVMGKLGNSFTDHYLHAEAGARAAGAAWRFDNVRQMTISDPTPGAPMTFGYRSD